MVLHILCLSLHSGRFVSVLGGKLDTAVSAARSVVRTLVPA